MQRNGQYQPSKGEKKKPEEAKTALLRTENVWICDCTGVLMNGCIDE